jgi:cell pole-organizing protein PopZ
MSQTAKVHEPSMEEILASIRRIIADDDNAKGAQTLEQAAPKTPPAPSRAPPAPQSPRPSPAAASSQTKIDAILAELDGPLKAASSPAPAMPVAAPSAVDTFEPSETMAPTPTPAPSFRTIDPASDVVFAERPYEPPPEGPAARTGDETRMPFSQSTMPNRALISASTMAAMDSAFNSLATTVIGQNARTLEDLVKEMLRPMLKTWLDDNLPSLVERIVRAEIERVSRGRS